MRMLAILLTELAIERLDVEEERRANPNPKPRYACSLRTTGQ